MPSKRTAVSIEPQDRAPTKAEACKLLQVASTADEELITKAYWHLARKYRAYARRDPEARQHLDEINRAYVALHPRGETPLASEMPAPVYEPPGFFEQLFIWWRKLVEHTEAVWPEHLGEVSVLTATTAVLTYLALAAGASALWTLLAGAIAGLVIWAPWRRA
jgi:hypothetical protein